MEVGWRLEGGEPEHHRSTSWAATWRWLVGRWLVGWWVAVWPAAGEVGGEVGCEVGTGHVGTLRVCPRSMKLKGCSGSKGKKESEMAAALAGPCSAAAVARQSCNRMASKRGEGVPR